MEATHQGFHPALWANSPAASWNQFHHHLSVQMCSFLFECCFLCNTEAFNQTVHLQSGISPLSAELWLWEGEEFFFIGI